MRVIVFVKATAESEGEVSPAPSPELLEAMGRYNEELVNAGIMLGGDGLKPSRFGARVAFEGANRVARRKLAYKALGDRMREQVHALSMKTLTPAEWAQETAAAQHHHH